MSFVWNACSKWAATRRPSTPLISSFAAVLVPSGLTARTTKHRATPCMDSIHLWCREYWDTPDDVVQMQVKRLLGERRYRFFTQEDPPKNVFWKASANFQMLRFRLILLGKDGSELQIHDFHGGYYQGSYRPHAGGEFISLRGEMGFAA